MFDWLKVVMAWHVAAIVVSVSIAFLIAIWTQALEEFGRQPIIALLCIDMAHVLAGLLLVASVFSVRQAHKDFRATGRKWTVLP